jgi:prepilin-type N-terminal cleavage/methylation domain-containing protein
MRTCSRTGADARGFTLLEVLLAILILGLILASVYGALSRTASSKQHAEERAELYSSGRQALLKIANDIEGALPPLSGDRIYFRGQAGSIEFVTMNRGGYGSNRVRPGRVLIAYSLDPLPNARDSFALRREEYLYAAMLAEADGIELPPPEEGEEEVPTAQATYLLDCPNVSNDLNLPGACMRVSDMRFRYFDEPSGSWVEEWDSTQEELLGRLPAAVEIGVVVQDADGAPETFTTIVDLPLSRGQPTPEPSAANPGANPGTNPRANTGGNDPNDPD